MVAAGPVDELRRNAYLITGLANAAFEHVARVQLLGDGANIRGLALVGKRRVAGHYPQPARTRQCRDDVFGYAVGEILLGLLAGKIVEWQHRDRGPVGNGVIEGRFGLAGEADTVGAHRGGDVFDLLFAHIFEIRLDAVADGFIDHS